MTKQREAVTVENTLYRVLGTLTIERAAEVTGRAESYLRALSDPDKRDRLTIEDAIKLDLEYRAGGREGYTDAAVPRDDAWCLSEIPAHRCRPWLE